MKNIKYTILPLCAALLASCGELNVDAPETALPEEPQTDVTVLTATIDPQTKTTLGDKDEKGQYKVSWTEGDKINVNGDESSEAVIAEGTASFSFGKEMTAPFKALYPSSAFKPGEGETVTVAVPAAQTYAAGTFDVASSLMYAAAEKGTALTFHHLMAYLKLSFSTASDEDNIKTITVKSRGTESMSGDFTLDFSAASPALVPASDKTGSITVGCGESGVAPGTEVVVAVPAQTYASGLEIVTTDVNGDKTTHLLKQEFVAAAGTVYPMPISFELYPGSRMKPITVHETVGGEEKDVVWAPVYCGYSAEHPNGLLYQYGRAKGQPYYPAAPGSAICKSGPVADPADDIFYKASGEWYSGTALTAWPMTEDETGYVEGKIGNPCPSGWRLPTVAEAEGLLKIGFIQSTAWSFGPQGTDEQKEAVEVTTGFTLKDDSGLFFAAVGGRTSGGQSYYRGTGADAYARLWCSDIKSGSDAGKGSCLNLQRNGTSVDPEGFKAQNIYALTKASGISVRCVKE